MLYRTFGHGLKDHRVTSWTSGTLTRVDLFGKVSAGDPTETGLGLTNATVDNEIPPGALVQLNLANLQAAGLTNPTFSIGSVQVGEGYQIFESDTAAQSGGTGTLFASGTGAGGVSQTVALGNSYDQFVWITASGGDVLLMNGLKATGVPEPATLLLLGFGLVGLSGITRKLKK